MSIRGYANNFPDSVEVERAIYDGSELMGRREFWAAHYLSQSIEDEDIVIQVWGVELEAVRTMQNQLSSSNSWPVFELDIGNGAGLAVVYRNFEDDPGVDYLITPSPVEDCIRIATLEGEYAGPGISWPEILAVAHFSPDPKQSARRLLLLAPMLGDVEAETTTGISTFVEALRVTGGTGDIERLAGLIASENLQWEPAHWYTTSDGVTVCDAEASPRNPDSVNALASADLRMISDILAL